MSLETILFQMCTFLLAPLLLGVVAKTKAVFAGRTGAPLVQPYYDLWKLFQKGAVYSPTTTWVFRAGPIAGLAAVAAAMLLLPVGKAAAPLAFDGDLVLLAGLLGLMRFATVLAALDTGSSFEGMGASREVTFSALAEAAFFLALMALVLVSGSLSLTSLLGPGLAGTWGSAAGPALALILVVIFLILLTENARIPVDDPNTHLELTMIHEVMVLDHSGPDLGYMLYAASIKLWLFSTILVAVALPFQTGNGFADGLVFLVGMLAVAILVGIVESSMARLRMVQVPHLLVTAGVLAALGVTMAVFARQ